MKFQKFKTFLLLNIIIIVIMNPIFMNNITSGEQSKRSSLMQHDPIHINGNNQFTLANGVVSGNGTENNPYIIENWDIDATDTGTYCVLIQNTNEYLIIRNNFFHNSLSWWEERAGIKLKNVRNCTIINNNCKNNNDGISLSSCNGITISNNSVNSNGPGILLSFSNRNTISNNDIDMNEFGIELFSSLNNIICSNGLSNNNRGLELVSSSDNLLFDNDFNSNIQYSIELSSSANNTIINNNCSSTYFNSIGISLFNSLNNTLENNTCSNNGYYGIYLQFSTNNKFINNVCLNNKQYAIYLKNAISNTFRNNKMLLSSLFIEGNKLEHWNTHNIYTTNTVNGKPVYYLKNMDGNKIPSDVGQIILANSTNIIIENQNVSDVSVGIELGFSNNNIIRNTICNSNIYYGIYLYSSLDNLLINNTIKSNMLYGIYIHLSSGNIVINNKCSFNDISGIYLESSSRNKFVNNDIYSNNVYGIAMYSLYSFSNNNIIENCTISSNTIYDLFIVQLSKNNYAINTTFDTIIVDYASELIVKNYLHVKVSNSSNSMIQNTNIQVKDNNKIIYSTSGYGGYNPKTNVFGEIKWILVTDRIYNGSNTAIENITTINVKYNGRIVKNSSRNLNMSTSHFEYFHINSKPNKIILKNPNNNTYINNPKPTLLWNKEIDKDSDPLTYFIELDEFDDDWTSLIANINTENSIWELQKSSQILISGKSYQWRVRAHDGFENGSWSNIWRFNIDTEAPSSEVSIPINNGYYNNLETISGNIFDINKGSGINKIEINIKQLSNNKYWNGTSWCSNESWLITKGTDQWFYNSSSVLWDTDISYLIRSRGTDNAGNIEIPKSGNIFMFDNKPPNLSIIINNDNIYTNSTSVTLLLSSEDLGSGIFHMSFSNDNKTWSIWESFLSEKTYNLPESDGEKTIYFKIIDNANNTAITSDTIILDRTPPSLLSILINNGSIVTNSVLVNIKINATDNTSGLYKLSLSTDGKNWEPWIDFKESINYILSNGEGIKIIHIRIMDRAGNIAKPNITTINFTTSELKTDNNYVSSNNWILFYVSCLIILIICIIIFLLIKNRKQKLLNLKLNIKNKNLENNDSKSNINKSIIQDKKNNHDGEKKK